MQGVTWPTDGQEYWVTRAGADLSLSPRNLLQPFSDTQGDLSGFGRDGFDRVGPSFTPDHRSGPRGRARRPRRGARQVLREGCQPVALAKLFDGARDCRTTIAARLR
jgi:hypothetical protein